MPRSPARDLSDRYTGKRGYFRKPHWIHRWKYVLAVLAFVAACCWAAFDVAQPSRAAYAHTHGPLTDPHAAFDDNCAACHKAHSTDNLFTLSAFNARDRWHSFTCGKCHAGANRDDFIHHASGTAEARKYHDRCSNCHHDHNGRSYSLIRLADADCNKCHADLAKWHDAAKSTAKPPFQNTVTGFTKDHPEFRSLDITEQPRTLRFSHALHMNPGQRYSEGGKEAMTLSRMRGLNPANPEITELYRLTGQDDDALVQLDCASCHKLDPGTGTKRYDLLKSTLDRFGEPSKSLLAPRPEGAYFLPINFEASCRACHPLTAPAGVSGNTILPSFSVPHRQQDLLNDLKAGYLKGMIAEKHELLNEPPPPGGKVDPMQGKNPRTLAEETERLALAAQRQLFSADGCAKCHVIPESTDTMRVAPVPDRTVWFKHAKFNHASHRGATCATCHPGTTAASISPVQANKPEPVQILGIQSCQACHSPAGSKVALPDGSTVSGGGIRHNCTDCHNYHHGDLPLQGRGAPMRFPKEPRDLADWLKGK